MTRAMGILGMAWTLLSAGGCGDDGGDPGGGLPPCYTVLHAAGLDDELVLSGTNSMAPVDPVMIPWGATADLEGFGPPVSAMAGVASTVVESTTPPARRDQVVSNVDGGIDTTELLGGTTAQPLVYVLPGGTGVTTIEVSSTAGPVSVDVTPGAITAIPDPEPTSYTVTIDGTPLVGLSAAPGGVALSYIVIAEVPGGAGLGAIAYAAPDPSTAVQAQTDQVRP